MAMKFSENFWGAGGWDIVNERIDQGKESAELLAYFFKERAQIEETYVKGLKNLLKRTEKLTEYGTTRDAWMTLRSECEQRMELHQQVSGSLQSSLAKPLSDFSKDQKSQVSMSQKEAAKMSKELTSMKRSIDSSRSRYERSAHDSEKAEADLEKARNTGKNLVRYTSRLQKLTMDVTKWENTYQDNVSKATQFQATYEARMVDIYDLFQELETRRLNYYREALSAYTSVLAIENGYSERVASAISQSVNQIDAERDIQEFISQKGTGAERPAPVAEFSPYAASPSAVRRSDPPMGSGTSSPAFASSPAMGARGSGGPPGGRFGGGGGGGGGGGAGAAGGSGGAPTAVAPASDEGYSFKVMGQGNRGNWSRGGGGGGGGPPGGGGGGPPGGGFGTGPSSAGGFGTGPSSAGGFGTGPTASAAAAVASSPQGGAGGVQMVTALYDYVGQDANELDFCEGDQFILVSQDDSGWWTGEIDGRTGLFPGNYCELI